jgi:glutamate synthase (NADPH) large chain
LISLCKENKVFAFIFTTNRLINWFVVKKCVNYFKHKEKLIQMRLPEAQGLYNPDNEHDNCGIGFVAHIKGKPSHEIIRRGLEVLLNMDHRGATSADNSTGDGAGLLMQIPHDFITNVLKLQVGEPGKYGTGLIFLPKDER